MVSNGSDQGVALTKRIPSNSVGRQMQISRSALALFVIAFSPIGAHAADLAAPPAAPLLSPSPVADWAGLYAGTFFGGGVGSFSDRKNAAASGTALGAATGTLVGYNWQNGAVVYGLEGDIGANYLNRKFDAAAGLPAREAESIYSADARARVGYEMGSFLPFVAGGLTYNRNDQFQRAPLDFEGQTRFLSGWNLGAGVDAKVDLPVVGPSIVRAEYLYEGVPTTSYNLGGPVLRANMSAQYARVALISTTNTSAQATQAANPNWDGNYVGAIGGLSRARITTEGLGAAKSFSASGPIGGVYSGYNWTFGRTMLGIDGATMAANVVGHGAEPGAADAAYQNFLESDMRGRAGYAIGRFLPFFAAGLDFGSSQQTDTANGNTRGNLPVLASTVGAGVEYLASDLVALRAEYLHSHSLLDESTHLDSDACCNQTRAANSFRLGLAYFLH
jgi:outer membrane immunogenic protein